MPTALLVAHHYPPHVGGLEIVVQKQADSLARSGYEVIVLTSRLDSGLTDEARQPGIEVVRVSCSHLLERRFFIPFPLFSPGLILQAWRQLKRAEIVHVHDVFYISSWVAAVLAWVARKPILLTQHVAMVDHPSGLVMGVQRLVYGTIGRWIFARARAIVAYNENVRAFLLARKVPGSKVLRMGNGIDTTFFRPAAGSERDGIRARHGLPLNRPLILFAGRLVEKKGFQILMQARDPAFDVVFVGPGNVPAEGRQPGLHWLGAREQSELAALMRACDVFAFPAVGEVFTLVMQEAMASGLPVVTTDDEAYADSIVTGHVVLCPRTAESFRNAILALLADPDRLRTLGLRGRELAIEHFDWNANVRQLVSLYSRELRNVPS